MSDDIETGSRKEKIVREAHKRFKRCQDWEATARARWLNDYKFANGDSDNNWQWDDQISLARSKSERPCLTVNKTRQHNLQIINDGRQNKAAVKISPVGDGATKEAADILSGVVRHIEYVSVAQDAYDQASKFQVEAGIGYWRVLTDYVDDDTFDQEIYIRPVRNPLNVYLDPDIVETDGSDARFGFIFSDQPREVVIEDYPQFKGRGSPRNSVDGEDPADGWITDDHIRVCEYYRFEPKTDKLIALPDGRTFRASEAPPGVARLALSDKDEIRDERVKVREVSVPKIRWYKIIGDEIVDERDHIGRYIPIVRVIGEETIVDGQLDRKGHTRALKDPQRIANYWRSSAVEAVALQTKSPWVVAMEAIEGVETYWGTANLVNHSYLPFKSMGENGPIPPPQRADPPQMPQAYLQGIQIADNDMMTASGQYQAQLGAPSNERSGKAIAERQRQGDNATYHYIDNMAKAIRFTGRIILDMIPHIYDTERVLHILAEDGTESHVKLDPSLQTAHQPSPTPDVAMIFNPMVGRYDVQADVGPAYATRREEAFNAFVQIVSQDQSLIPIVGDLMFKAADFPMAEEIAERLHNMVPPQALGGPSPQVQQAQQLAQKFQAIAEQATKALAEEQLKLKAKDSLREIEVYKAETERMNALKDALPMADPAGLRVVVRQMVLEALNSGLAPVTQADLPALKDDATNVAPSTPMPGGPGQPA